MPPDTEPAGPSGLTTQIRLRLAKAALSPFAHAPYPLARTLEYMGDPGLIGPDSVSWLVIGDVAAFVGGIRGLLIQAAHPEVVAGVGDHSRYREDPLGRLSRTSSYVTATTYGAMPEVEQAVERVRRIHRTVFGISNRGNPYSAGDPNLAAWVHNALTDSFLVAHQVYSDTPLSRIDADRFVEEQSRIGILLDADPLPTTARELAAWVEEHPELAPSPHQREATEFLISPPLDPGLRLGYGVLMRAATATIPPRLRGILGLSTRRGSMTMGRAAVRSLRWALGHSPSWRLALERTGAEIPEEKFLRTI